MSLLNVNYRPPDNEFNMKKRVNFTSVAKCPDVKEEEIFANLLRVIMTMKEDPSFLISGDPGYHETFKWSFYEAFGIPPYSFTNICMQSNYKKIFNRLNKSADTHILDDFLNNTPDTSVIDIFEENSEKYHQDKQPYNLFLITNWHLPNLIDDSVDYKIHFCVKEEYALYVLMKAMTIMNNRAKEKTRETGIAYRSIGKIMTFFEYSKNTIIDGGIRYALPTVVIYTGTTSKTTVRSILEEFIRAFPESEEIGLCELGNPERIPYGNIRLNKLICYAKGDRGMKIKAVKSNMMNLRLKSGYRTQKTIPPWILEMRNTCRISSEASRRSKHFFGVDLCKPEYSNLVSNSRCIVQPFCYLSPTLDLLDPNTIKGVQVLDPNTREYPPKYNPIGSLAQRSIAIGGKKRTRRIRKKSRSRR
jgi:hypothetical protein